MGSTVTTIDGMQDLEGNNYATSGVGSTHLQPALKRPLK